MDPESVLDKILTWLKVRWKAQGLSFPTHKMFLKILIPGQSPAVYRPCDANSQSWPGSVGKGSESSQVPQSVSICHIMAIFGFQTPILPEKHPKIAIFEIYIFWQKFPRVQKVLPVQKFLRNRKIQSQGFPNLVLEFSYLSQIDLTDPKYIKLVDYLPM